jgi:hypothetical protein
MTRLIDFIRRGGKPATNRLSYGAAYNDRHTRSSPIHLETMVVTNLSVGGFIL